LNKLDALRNVLRDRLLRYTGFEIKAEYVDSPPSQQNAIDLFQGEWASRLPGPYTSGENELFADHRIEWLLAQLRNLDGQRVLDCGPLEGGHAFLLEQTGADVLAIEANTRAFLRCLIAKEVLGMRSQFQLGNFIAVLERGEPFNLIVASGVLYHLLDPVATIAYASRCTDHLYIWTHYYQAGTVAGTLKFAQPHEHEVSGFRHTLHRQFYQTKVGNRAFFGGAHDSSCWLERQGLIDALTYFGFDQIRIRFDDVNSSPGPSIALLASKTAK
jgi:hypothetical protein